MPAPFMGTLTLTSANTSYQLSQLLIDSGKVRDYGWQETSPIIRRVAQYLAIQLASDSGGAELFIGNADVSSTNCGVSIFATQVYPIYSMDANLVNLDNIYVRCATGGVKINVSFITR